MTQHPTTRLRTRTAYQSMRSKREEHDQLSGKEDEGTTDEWVDEEEEEMVVGSAKHSMRLGSPAESMTSSTRSTPRKRESRKATYAVNGLRKQVPPLNVIPRKPSPPAPESPKVDDHRVRDAVVQGIFEGILFTIRYAMDILGTVVRLLRVPISIFLLFWLLSFMIGHLSQTVRRAFEPLCIIPGISSTPMCRPQHSKGSLRGGPTPQWADYSKLVEVQSKSFEQLLEESAGGSALSLEIKKAEMVTTDLVVRVQISNLKAKDTLAASLQEFVSDAKKTGRSLQKLTSKVGGAVDSILAVNDYALQSIAAARANEPSSWSTGALALWKPPRKSVNEVVMQTFDEAMNVLSNNMGRLIVEAESTFNNLNELEERLATLHEIISREDSTISSEKSQLLEDLWTKLGGNRQSLRNFDHHLTLLKGLSTYRKQALVHVVAALQTLRAMSEDMEDMRERVAAPDLMGSSIPAEVHMKSISMGLERLKEGRMKAKRLEEEAVKKVLSIDSFDDDS